MLGQYFTENIDLQRQIFNLRKNNGSILEPSFGCGHIAKFFEDNGAENVTAVEIDDSLKSKTVSNIKPMYMDFFDYSIDNKYDSVIGNPPFVKYNYMSEEFKARRIQDSVLRSCNLFYYFIEKSFYHLNKGGEIIFIIPREFFNSSRASKLRELLYEHGTITDIIDYEEGRFFKDAAPNIIIIRYEKDNHSHITNYIENGRCYTKDESIYNGSFFYTTKEHILYTLRLGDVFDIKVGLVSGLNEVFEYKSKFSIPTICSDYRRTGKKRKFIFADEIPLHKIEMEDPKLYNHLLQNKSALISRNIKKFDEDDWFHYGAVRNLSFMRKQGRCIYVNTKTRHENPFFIDDIDYFDGSVLGLFISKQKNIWSASLSNLDLNEWCYILNNSVKDFKEQGMYVSNKFLFTVKSLSDFKVNIYYNRSKEKENNYGKIL